MAKVISVNISDRKGVCKIPVKSIKLIKDYGIENDAHAGVNNRQVSLLAVESIRKFNNIKPGDFAENITTEGIELYKIKIGTKIKIGEALLEITQIGKQCHKDCEIKKLIGECAMPKEGIFAKVLESAEIKKGDNIIIVNDIKIGVIISSDKCSRNERKDLIVNTIKKELKEYGYVVASAILPDEKDLLVNKMKEFCERKDIDVIITSGGTGLSPRDVTPEATLEVINKRVDGISEAIRYHGLRYTHNSILSRGVAGIRGNTLIVNLPGSVRAVIEGLEVLLPILNHSINLINGKVNECGRNS